jgi:hypothetical protein
MPTHRACLVARIRLNQVRLLQPAHVHLKGPIAKSLVQPIQLGPMAWPEWHVGDGLHSAAWPKRHRVTGQSCLPVTITFLFPSNDSAMAFLPCRVPPRILPQPATSTRGGSASSPSAALDSPCQTPCCYPSHCMPHARHRVVLAVSVTLPS